MTTTEHPLAPDEIMAFVDGELSADRTQSVSAHVGQCTECTALVSELRDLSVQMAVWQVETVPERSTARVVLATQKKLTDGWPVLGSVISRPFTSLRFVLGAASSLAALVLFLAITTPNLLRSRMAANESSAVGSLRVLNTAANIYSGVYGHYPPSLKSFGPPSSGAPTENAAGLVDPTLAGGRKSGYQFTYQTTPAGGRDSRGGYAIQATPIEPGKGGYRHFSTNETGAIFADGAELGGPSLPDKAQGLGHQVLEEQEIARQVAETSPMIARTAELRLVVKRLDEAREEMDRILARHKGFVGRLSASAENGSERVLIASLRVPADQLDACLAALKKLGHVTHESQAGEEVTQQHVDLLARSKNSRNTEARLNDVLRQRGGPIKEILEVEKGIGARSRRNRANGSRAANAGAPRQLRHHRPETCRRVQGGAHYSCSLRCHPTSQRARRRLSHRLPKPPCHRVVFRRVWSSSVAMADDPVVSGLAAMAPLSTQSRDGINRGSLRAGCALCEISPFLRNRLHELDR